MKIITNEEIVRVLDAVTGRFEECLESSAFHRTRTDNSVLREAKKMIDNLDPGEKWRLE